jgi:hypothetical protein
MGKNGQEYVLKLEDLAHLPAYGCSIGRFVEIKSLSCLKIVEGGRSGEQKEVILIVCRVN